MVNWDAEKVTQLLILLIDNAIKYTSDKGTVQVTIAEGKEKGAHYFTIEVKDNGIGIAAEAIPRIFDRFYRPRINRERVKLAVMVLDLRSLRMPVGALFMWKVRLGRAVRSWFVFLCRYPEVTEGTTMRYLDENTQNHDEEERRCVISPFFAFRSFF